MNKVLCICMLAMGCLMNTQAQTNCRDSIMNISLDSLQKNADKFVGKTVSFSGKAMHVCSRSGMKLFLQIPGQKGTFQVNSTKELGKFPRTCNNRDIAIVGVVQESRIDEDFLKRWEQSIQNKTEEQHGDEKSGCEAEKEAKQETGDSSSKRIADFRKRIAERRKQEEKNYLSFYNVTATSYKVLK